LVVPLGCRASSIRDAKVKKAGSWEILKKNFLSHLESEKDTDSRVGNTVYA